MAVLTSHNDSSNGHSENEYFMASEEESQRLSNQHNVIKDAMPGKKLVCAPIDLSSSQLRILDSGTADGTWIIDLNESTGGQHVLVGTDLLEAELPRNHPSNVTFHAQDINNPWPREYEESFDLIHQRLTLPFAGAKWKEALSALTAMIKPGGWIQLMEGTLLTPNSVDRNPCMNRYLSIVHAIYTSLGAPLTLSKDIPKWLFEEAGFVNIQSQEIHVEMGASNANKDLGKRGASTQRLAAMGMVEAAKKLKSSPIAEEDLTSFPEDFAKEMAEKGACFPIVAIWAQKRA